MRTILVTILVTPEQLIKSVINIIIIKLLIFPLINVSVIIFVFLLIII